MDEANESLYSITMFQLVLLLLLAALTVTSVTLQKTYQKTPIKELKRRANKGDEVAKALYSAVTYGVSLQLLLWIILGISAGGFFVVLSISTPTWLALFGSIALLWLAFAWLPNTRVTDLSQRLAKQLAPAFAWIMARLYPLLKGAADFVHKHSRISVHTGLYQKEDVIELLEKQQHQPDNRMTADELKIVSSALTFSDKLIRDVMTPKRVVKMVRATDSIGPVLMSELHKSGFSRFPVYSDNPDKVTGTLYLHDLVSVKAEGTVANKMKKTVYYVNEEKPLGHALQAFLKTKHHLFIVVNSFEEVVGIITIEDVLEQVVGKRIVDEFDRYDDLRAVAALQAKQEQKANKHAVSPEPETDVEPTDIAHKK